MLSATRYRPQRTAPGLGAITLSGPPAVRERGSSRSPQPKANITFGASHDLPGRELRAGRPAPATEPRAARRTMNVLCALVVLVLIGLAPPGAWADDGDDAADAFTLVRQAIALIVNTPGDETAIDDKVDDALAADDTHNVDLALVSRAKDILAAGDLHQARGLLEQSIGARVHTSTADPVPIGRPAPVTGEQTGTLAAIDAMPGRQGLTAADWTLLAICLVTAAFGLVLSARLRSHLPRLDREGATP